MINEFPFNELRSWVMVNGVPKMEYCGHCRAGILEGCGLCLMVWTGYTDRNNKKVYTKDIVGVNCKMGVVDFKEGSFIIKWFKHLFRQNTFR